MSRDTAPALVWFHRDLRLRDQASLHAAVASGRPVLPFFVLDDETSGRWATGGAQRWWLHHTLQSLAADLRARGAGLLLLRGRFEDVVPALCERTGAAELHVGQPTEPWARGALDRLRTRLGDRLQVHRTTTLFDPDEIRTQSGGGYAVFSAFARACRARFRAQEPLPAPEHIPGAPAPPGDALADWRLLPTKSDWAGGLRETWVPGEAEAQRRLLRIVAQVVPRYELTRNLPGQPGTSMLSPHLHWGEISAREVWHAVERAGEHAGIGAYLNEILWREFSKHLLWHHPDLPEQELRPEFRRMPWRADAPALRAWQRGRTGIPIVDAGMRQLWALGWMHNRVRMIVASFLVKHLMIRWQEGEAWFWDTLVDADLASNSASWQWVAGCGADAVPFFRVFNPALQGAKFDPDATYVRRWVPEVAGLETRFIHAPWEAPEDELRRAGVRLGETYPFPVINLRRGRSEPSKPMVRSPLGPSRQPEATRSNPDACI
ncbi:MAG: deoxyribodipyrimidine photo-lyase, partial [Acetobacteraceae bacterium]|nr:deoxyribodipyrimidine photo-lyase [Acetobacteraceae bacterium]